MSFQYPIGPPDDAIINQNVAYTVDSIDPFAISVWNIDNPNPDGTPFLYQPQQPDGTPWPDQATAQAFADQWVTSYLSS